MNIIKTATKLLCALVFTSFTLTHSAHAENKVVDILPPVTHAKADAAMPGDVTHDVIYLTPDRSEIINLDKRAGSIIIGNPAHLNIIADSANRLVVVPRASGATHFTILAQNGDIIMQRHAIIAGPKQDYIKIKRTCTGDECKPSSVFYCPGMCHEIQSNMQGQSTSGGGSSSGGASGNSANQSPPVNDQDTFEDER